MIDELDLAFDEHDDRSRHRRRHAVDKRSRKKKKKKRGRGRSFLALFMTLLLLGGLAAGAWLGYGKIRDFFTTPDYTTAASSPEIKIEIKQGATIADMAKALKAADVIKSEKAFTDAAAANSKALSIQPGFYQMRTQLSGADAVLMLLDLKNRLVKGIVIPEGLITLQIYDKLSKELKLPLKDFTEAAKDPIGLGVPAWWFNRKDGKTSVKSIEGFLFPAQYEFPPNTTAKSALQAMVQKFLAVTTSINFVDRVQSERGISPHEALVAASIAQVEAVNEADLAPVARVLYNRVYTGRFPCNCLQIDSAVNYWLRLSGKLAKDSNDIVVSEQHNKKDPYNTFDFKGLPPGPISNPGEVALKGAMDPPKNNYMYFMSIDKKGTMGWAVDWNGHLANIRTACKNGILSGGTCKQ